MKKILIFMIGTIGIISLVRGNVRIHSDRNCAENSFVVIEDTTIYKAPAGTAELQDVISYFRQNNKYKDWDKSNPKKVYLRGIVEKDGTINSVKIIRSSEIKELDDEALRLIKAAKYSSGKNEKGKDVRSVFSIAVNFPAQ